MHGGNPCNFVPSRGATVCRRFDAYRSVDARHASIKSTIIRFLGGFAGRTCICLFLCSRRCVLPVQQETNQIVTQLVQHHTGR
jgi:hypothetical protein